MTGGGRFAGWLAATGRILEGTTIPCHPQDQDASWGKPDGIGFYGRYYVNAKVESGCKPVGFTYIMRKPLAHRTVSVTDQKVTSENVTFPLIS